MAILATTAFLAMPQILKKALSSFGKGVWNSEVSLAWKNIIGNRYINWLTTMAPGVGVIKTFGIKAPALAARGLKRWKETRVALAGAREIEQKMSYDILRSMGSIGVGSTLKLKSGNMRKLAKEVSGSIVGRLKSGAIIHEDANRTMNQYAQAVADSLKTALSSHGYEPSMLNLSASRIRPYLRVRSFDIAKQGYDAMDLFTHKLASNAAVIGISGIASLGTTRMAINYLANRRYKR